MRRNAFYVADNRELNCPMPRMTTATTAILFTTLLLTVTSVVAQDSVAYLRIVGLDFPHQVAPGKEYRVTIKFAYAFHSEEQVKGAVYVGAVGDLTNKLWESEPMTLAEEETRALVAIIRAPEKEVTLELTAYVLVFNTTWVYFTDPDRGPGFRHFSIKVSEFATLTVSVGFPSAQVSIDGRAFLTNGSGLVSERVSILAEHRVQVPDLIQMTEQSRALFLEWSDGGMSPSRSVSLSGDVVLEAHYQKQHFLRVLSEVGNATGSGWYNEGEVARFSASESVRFDGVMSLLGAVHVFESWTGDSSSRAREAAIVMDAPYSVEATYQADYSGAWFVAIFPVMALVGVIVGMRVRVGMKQNSEEISAPVQAENHEPTESKLGRFCVYCGSGVEDGARFCAKCGRRQG